MRTRFAVILGLVFSPITAFAASQITISAALPGKLSNVASSGPGAFISNFYQYAPFISGILAFGAIVYGGLKYAWARGNPSGETEARAWIWSALLGFFFSLARISFCTPSILVW